MVLTRRLVSLLKLKNCNVWVTIILLGYASFSMSIPYSHGSLVRSDPLLHPSPISTFKGIRKLEDKEGDDSRLSLRLQTKGYDK